MVTAAVVGGGVFGCSVAIELARAGAHVTLFEAHGDVLEGTTARCQGRLHIGYHYPRSERTAIAARDGALEFAYRYPSTLIDDNDHFYAVAVDSKTTADEFLEFCDRLNLPYEEVKLPFLRNIDICVRVPEYAIDLVMLRKLLKRDLMREHVSVVRNKVITDNDILNDQFDWVVWATYGNEWPVPLRYEICEMPLFELGRYNRESVVIIDGEYTSLDHVGRNSITNLFSLYDVDHSVHWSMTGMAKDVIDQIPLKFKELLQRPALPIRRNDPSTRFESMINSAGRFFWGLEPWGGGLSIYHGSLWSIRAVLPNADATDERPTIIRTEPDSNSVWILSGKISTAVPTAKKIAELVGNQ